MIDYIVNPDPLEGEDISIVDDTGNVTAVVIQSVAYQSFLHAVEEREDEQDGAVNAPFDPNAKSLDDMSAEAKNQK